MICIFNNPFNPRDDVRIRGNFTNYEDIPISETFDLITGLNKFVYIVNGSTIYLPNSLWFIDCDGNKFNYIIIENNRINKQWLIQSHKIGDFSHYIYYLYQKGYDSDTINRKILINVLNGNIQTYYFKNDNLNYLNILVSKGDCNAFIDHVNIDIKCIKIFINHHLLNAKRGNRHSMYILGYYFTTNILPNYVKKYGREYLALTDEMSLNLIEKSANLGYTEAILYLYNYYKLLDDCKNAKKWWTVYVKKFNTNYKFIHSPTCCLYSRIRSLFCKYGFYN